MSRKATDDESRIELIKELFAANARDELESLLESAQPDLILDWSHSRGVRAGVYKGREAAFDFFAAFVDVWDELEYFHDEFIPLGETIVRVGGMRAKGRGSGVEITAKGAQVFEFRDGLLARMTLYQAKDEALAAVGERPER